PGAPALLSLRRDRNGAPQSETSAANLPLVAKTSPRSLTFGPRPSLSLQRGEEFKDERDQGQRVERDATPHQRRDSGQFGRGSGARARGQRSRRHLGRGGGAAREARLPAQALL